MAEEVKVKKGLSIAGMVCAIVAFVLSFIPCINVTAWILAILGIIFGAIGLAQANKNPNKEGKGMAITAIVLGVIAFIWPFIAIFIIFGGLSF